MPAATARRAHRSRPSPGPRSKTSLASTSPVATCPHRRPAFNTPIRGLDAATSPPSPNRLVSTRDPPIATCRRASGCRSGCIVPCTASTVVTMPSSRTCIRGVRRRQQRMRDRRGSAEPGRPIAIPAGTAAACLPQRRLPTASQRIGDITAHGAAMQQFLQQHRILDRCSISHMSSPTPELVDDHCRIGKRRAASARSAPSSCRCPEKAGDDGHRVPRRALVTRSMVTRPGIPYPHPSREGQGGRVRTKCRLNSNNFRLLAHDTPGGLRQYRTRASAFRSPRAAARAVDWRIIARRKNFTGVDRHPTRPSARRRANRIAAS